MLCILEIEWWQRKKVSAEMSSSGYNLLPSDPPPAYTSGAAGVNKDTTQAAAQPCMPSYPGICYSAL